MTTGTNSSNLPERYSLIPFAWQPLYNDSADAMPYRIEEIEIKYVNGGSLHVIRKTCDDLKGEQGSENEDGEATDKVGRTPCLKRPIPRRDYSS